MAIPGPSGEKGDTVSPSQEDVRKALRTGWKSCLWTNRGSRWTTPAGQEGTMTEMQPAPSSVAHAVHDLASAIMRMISDFVRDGTMLRRYLQETNDDLSAHLGFDFAALASAARARAVGTRT